VLFDKDGTLLDYRRTWEPINREAATLAAGGDPVLALLARRPGLGPGRASWCHGRSPPRQPQARTVQARTKLAAVGGSNADVIALNGGAFADFAAVQAASRQEGADVVRSARRPRRRPRGRRCRCHRTDGPRLPRGGHRCRHRRCVATRDGGPVGAHQIYRSLTIPFGAGVGMMRTEKDTGW
jgi:phosphoglycolate phosphatase-like HAD superfamily hydrolase